MYLLFISKEQSSSLDLECAKLKCPQLAKLSLDRQFNKPDCRLGLSVNLNAKDHNPKILFLSHKMVQIADSTQAAHRLNTRPDLDIFLRPFVPRNGTQRHCDHLERLQTVQCGPRERRIECYEVALFLEAACSEVATFGYWEVDGRSSAGPTWTPIVCCETFELLVECPPGKRITFVLNPRPAPASFIAFRPLRSETDITHFADLETWTWWLF